MASRGGSGRAVGSLDPTAGDPPVEVTLGVRHQRSDRHFRGRDQETNRRREGSEVINDSEFIELSLTYPFTPRLGATLTIPYVEHVRSQVVRDNNRNILGRFQTQSAGVGDLRLLGTWWVAEPHGEWNVQLGLGLDMPTGDDHATDTFQTFQVSTGSVLAVERTVDQSIQPGDGGWGVVVDALSYYSFGENWNVYAAGTYTLTPQEDNGVLTYRSNPYEAEMSIPDTYVGRLGVEYRVGRMVVGLGGRIEGVAVKDLWGGDDDFRRPGYALSVEPGFSMAFDHWSLGLQVPIATHRNRQRSIPDKDQSHATGTHVHGDAAFADYLVMLSLTHRF